MQSNQNNTQNWYEYLDEHFKNAGTRTNMQEILLPKKEKINVPKVQNENLINKNSNQINLPKVKKKKSIY